MALNKDSNNTRPLNDDRVDEAVKDAFTQDVDSESVIIEDMDSDNYGYGNEEPFDGFDGGFTGSLDDILDAPIDNSLGNERAQTLLKAFNERLAERSNRKKLIKNIGLIEFDALKLGFEVPSIIGYHKVMGSDGQLQAIAYSVLMVEYAELKARGVNINGRVVELPTTLFENYDPAYNAQVIKTLAENVEGFHPGVVVLFSGVSSVYDNVDITDPYVTSNILGEFAKQVLSAVTDESIHRGRADQSHSLGNALRSGGYYMTASINRRARLTDPSGLPIHTDMLITTIANRMVGGSNDRGGNEFNRERREQRELQTIGVMMDLDYVGPSKNNHSLRDRRLSRREAEPVYMGNVIITYFDNRMGNSVLASLLLGLSTVMIACADEVYPEMFKTERNHDYPVLGDIGDIGYDVPSEDGEYGRIDVNSSEFTAEGDAALYDMVYENIMPDLTVSIDIPETILGARPIKVLEKTTVGDKKVVRQAEDRIVDTLDKLTDGAFLDSDIWVTGEPILSPDAVMVPMGYYVDPNGNRRDLREINYLAVRSFSGKRDDDQMRIRWINSYYGDPIAGVAERIAIMELIVGRDNVHVKGYAWRYKISAAFLSALAEATVDTGIAPSYNDLNDNDANRIRANIDDYNSYMVDSRQAGSYAKSTRSRRGGRGNRGRLSRNRSFR